MKCQKGNVKIWYPLYFSIYTNGLLCIFPIPFSKRWWDIIFKSRDPIHCNIFWPVVALCYCVVHSSAGTASSQFNNKKKQKSVPAIVRKSCRYQIRDSAFNIIILTSFLLFRFMIYFILEWVTTFCVLALTVPVCYGYYCRL